MEAKSRHCVWCAEPIDAAATFCPFCDGSAEGPPAAAAPRMPAGPSGTSTLVWGIVSLVAGPVFCPLMFAGLVAWWLGNKHERECRELGLEPESTATIGKILGMIATGLLGVFIVCMICFIAIMVTVAVQSTP